jgi:isocitrate/isopropylmalate dehydrogenase
MDIPRYWARSWRLASQTLSFEPVHGSAPDIRNEDKANPIAMVLSPAMMLEWLGEAAQARRIQEAVTRALSAGGMRLLPDATVKDGTASGGRAISAQL